MANAPVLAGGHILPNDSAAAWGVDVHGSMVAGSFINNHNLPAQPYYSKYGGVVLYEWTAEFSTGVLIQSAHVQTLVATPNPTSGAIALKGLLPHASLSVFDAWGRLVLEERSTAATALLDMSGQVPGLYTISERTGSGTRTARVLLLPE
ncbi:MAG: T9SS type A sorting domain-containing protein [Flavobacteriales bacterium]|nr:T9SS type A sorting domain-containing protein [Flavobacteriales bacterium]